MISPTKSKLSLLVGTLLLLTLTTSCGSSRHSSDRTATSETKYEAYAVAFYNVENLFDAEDDTDNKGDDEFLPSGPYNWTQAKYEKKLHNIASVIAQLGREVTPAGPAIIGLAEVENKRVCDDLVARPEIADMGLQVIDVPSPDWRGIETALLYNPKLFKVTDYKAYRYPEIDFRPGYRTRDQLLVSGILAGESFHVLVCHWPSRYGGKSSSIYRETAAKLSKHIADSLYNDNPRAKLIIMGDLNDDPVDNSTAKVLGAKRTPEEVGERGFFNATWEPYAQGIGTLTYQGKWNLFDQMILTEPLLDNSRKSLSFWRVEIFNRSFLIRQEGSRKGTPHRTFEGNTFINGYSDHLPVITYLIKERQ